MFFLNIVHLFYPITRRAKNQSFISVHTNTYGRKFFQVYDDDKRSDYVYIHEKYFLSIMRMWIKWDISDVVQKFRMLEKIFRDFWFFYYSEDILQTLYRSGPRV